MANLTGKSNIEKIVERQHAISEGELLSIDLPKYTKYTVCNLRGGNGKTTLSFNLAYLGQDVLAVDTCPQGSLSYFFDNNYFSNSTVNIYNTILPYVVPGLGRSTRVAKRISATNPFFASVDHDHAFYIASAEELYMFPSQMANALSQARALSSPQQEQVMQSILLSLKVEIEREMEETGCTRCIIDTSPFFAGATHLSWHATDALIIPVRTDQQSINSLNMLLRVLSESSSEFRKNALDLPTPKIQMIVLTHSAWSTVTGSRNVPNQQTKVYLRQIEDIVNRNISHFTTTEPHNHLVILDDFLGSGRISSALSKPIELLEAGESARINHVRTTVNASVEKCKNQLRFINNSIWQ